MLSPANGKDTKRVVDDVDFHSLRVVLVRAVIHFELYFKSIGVPLDAEASIIY
jgi:hypothetical protein